MIQAEAPALVLASQSAARQAVLASAGLRFEARPARIDEGEVKRGMRAEGAGPDETALALAGLKAARVRDPEALVIGADQLLVCDGAWFDKPADLAAARAQLEALRGRTHTLVTAVVCRRGGQEIWRHVARPALRMRAFSDAFLEAYLAREGDSILSSVGAYRLEGLGVHLFEAAEGEHAAILGLPLLPLLGFLRQHGVLTT
ncbi:MAG TPA: Maf family protein [Acetobacteraceae bacterium]|nr:Maf family protein [Acetobacteraceae bacterium]